MALDRLLARSQAWQFWQFVADRAQPEQGAIVLSQKRVYILPTRHGWTFSLALILMLIGSINYELSLGFVLTFLLAGMGIVSILHTFRNLAQLAVSPGRIDPAYAGGAAVFRLDLANPTRHARWGVYAAPRRGERAVRRARAGARRARARSSGGAPRLAAARPGHARYALSARPAARLELRAARREGAGLSPARRRAAAGPHRDSRRAARRSTPAPAATTSPACARTRRATRRGTSRGSRPRAAAPC